MSFLQIRSPYFKNKTIVSGALNLLELTETVTFSDVYILSTGKVLTETATFTDTLIRLASKIYTETVTFTDTLLKNWQTVLTETVTYTDTLVKQAGKLLTETVTLTDTLLKDSYRVFTEIVTLTDTLIRQISKTLTETVILTDVLGVIRSVLLELTETITFTDTLSKLTGKVLVETTTLTDTLLRLPSKILSETVTFAEALIGSVTVGTNSPSSVVDDATLGSKTWSNPGNVTTTDDTYATVVVDTGEQSHYLKATGFGFDIPPQATIDGIVVEWEKKKTGGGGSGAIDNAVRIVKGGTIGSTDKSKATEWPTSDTYLSYGNSSDLWGETWTPSDINASDFGTALSGKETQGNIFTLNVDHVRVTIYYSLYGLQRSTTKVLSDIITFSDIIIKTGQKVFTETVTLIDILTNLFIPVATTVKKYYTGAIHLGKQLLRRGIGF